MEASLFYTRALTAELVIVQSMYLQVISLQVASGTCTVRGSLSIDNVASEDITLSAGQTLVIPAKGPNAPLDGITITPVGGTTNFIGTR